MSSGAVIEFYLRTTFYFIFYLYVGAKEETIKMSMENK